MKNAEYAAVFAAGAALSTASAFDLTGRLKEVRLGEVAIAVGMGRPGLGYGYLPMLFCRMVPIVLFQIVFGAYLYRHYCTASVYYFSRCTRRMGWYRRELYRLAAYTVCYVLFSFLVPAAVLGIKKTITVEEGDIILALCHLAIYFLWLFATALLVNLLSVLWGSVAAVGTVVGGQFLCLVLFGYLAKWFAFGERPVEELQVQAFVLKCIPLSHLVLAWHSGGTDGVAAQVGMLGISFDFRVSVAAFSAACVLIVLFGGFLVLHTEFLGNGKEE